MLKRRKSSDKKGEGLGALRRLWPFMRPHKGLFFSWLLFMALSSGANLVLPVAVRRVINEGFAASDLTVLDQTFIALFVVALVIAFTTAARFYCITLLGERSLADLRRHLYDHLIYLDIGFYEKSRVGELISRLDTDTELVQTLVGTGISVALRSTVMLIGATAAMIVTSPRLAGLTALVIPAVMLPMLIFGRKVRQLSRHSQDRLADASAIANETLNANQTIKAYSRENIESLRYGSAIRIALSTARRRIGTQSSLRGAAIALVFGAITLVLWSGARDVMAGDMNAGVLGQFVLYAIFAAGSVGGVSGVWALVMRASGAMGRIGELQDQEPEVREPAEPVRLAGGATGNLRFSNVEFRYPTRPETAALKDFSLTVQQGETVALVGPSGAGKSTVFGLLMRFYDPQQGSIGIDGVDLRSLALSDLRGAFALVPQDTVIFAGNALDNIRFGNSDADDAAVYRAAEAAEADAFIRELPQGYDTELGERGIRLSGGQRQRVAIARAILRDAPVLLLDEATSALDARSEAAIQHALERLERGRTTLVIAHRLATVKRADRIVVMDAGQIVAQGTHDSLLAEGGLYADLAHLQFGNAKFQAGSPERERITLGNQA